MGAHDHDIIREHLERRSAEASGLFAEDSCSCGHASQPGLGQKICTTEAQLSPFIESFDNAVVVGDSAIAAAVLTLFSSVFEFECFMSAHGKHKLY